MSIRDYYLMCCECGERVFVTALRVNRLDVPTMEVAEFVVEHFGHDVRLCDEEGAGSGCKIQRT